MSKHILKFHIMNSETGDMEIHTSGNIIGSESFPALPFIKAIRMITDCSLRDAKEFSDNFQKELRNLEENSMGRMVKEIEEDLGYFTKKQLQELRVQTYKTRMVNHEHKQFRL